MSVEGIWWCALQPARRPDGEREKTPYFTLLVRAEGEGLVAEMYDDRGSFLVASAVQTWRGVGTPGGARFEMPVQYRLGGRMGDFRLTNVSDAARVAINARGLTRTLTLSLSDDGGRLDGTWADFSYITEFRDSAFELAEVVPRGARFSAERRDVPVRWVDSRGAPTTQVTSGTVVLPQVPHTSHLIPELSAEIVWPRGRRRVPITTDNSLARGNGPAIVVRADDAPLEETPDDGALIVRLRPGEAVTARSFGRTARLVVDARETRKRLRIAGLLIDDAPVRVRWADAIAPLLSRRDDLQGSVQALEDELARRVAAHAVAEKAHSDAISALEGANEAHATLRTALETRISDIKASSKGQTYLDQLATAEADARRAIARRAQGERGVALQPPATRAELEAAVATAQRIAVRVLQAVYRLVDTDSAVLALSEELAVQSKARDAIARTLGSTSAAEHEAREALKDVVFELEMTRTSAQLAQERVAGLEAHGPRLVHVQFTTSDGVAFDAGVQPDPALIAHFRALLGAADAEVAAVRADRDAAAAEASTAAAERRRSQRAMLDAFYDAQVAGASVAVNIRRNALLRLGVHVAVDIFELGKAAAKDGWAGLVAEAAGKLVADWMSDTDDQTQTFDESELRARFEAVYADQAAADTVTALTGEAPLSTTTLDATRYPDVPFQGNVSATSVGISKVKVEGLAAFQAWHRTKRVVPRQQQELAESVKAWKARLAELSQPSRGGGFIPRREALQGMGRNVAAFGGFVQAREKALAAALAAVPPDPAAIGSARAQLAKARADYDDAVGVYRRLQRRLKIKLAQVGNANRAVKRAADKLAEARKAQKAASASRSLLSGGRDVVIDQLVIFGKDWINNYLDETEAAAWLLAFNAELLYATAVRICRRAHQAAWLADEERLEADLRLRAVEARRAEHQARLEQYLADRAPTAGTLPIRVSEPFWTDAAPLTLRMQGVGGDTGYNALISKAGDALQAPLVARPAPASTTIPVGEDAAVGVAIDVVLGPRRFEEHFEDADVLDLHLTVG